MVGLPGAGGLPAGQALHARFEVHHRPVAEQFHTAQVTIVRHSSAETFDPDAGQTSFPTPTTAWTGTARVQRMTQQEITRAIGDRQVVIRGVIVAVPADAAEVRISDEVRVTGYRDANSGDPHLDDGDRPLWVHDIYPGSLLFERHLVVLDAPPTER